MSDAEQGRPTIEAHILVCRDCGHEVFLEHKRTKNAVVRKCAHCGTRVSVQGSIAVARVDTSEATFARQSRRVDPDPNAGRNPAVPSDVPEDDEDEDDSGERPAVDDDPFKYLRFSIPGSGIPVIDYAFDIYRVEHMDQEEMQGQKWRGVALVNIMADRNAGAPRWACQIVDAVNEAVDLEAARVEAEEGRKLPARHRSKIARQVREKALEGLGRHLLGDQAGTFAEPLPTAPFEDAAAMNRARAEERAAQAATDAEDERVPDDGSLMDSVRMARDEMPESMRHMVHIGGPERLLEFTQMHERSGGYLLRVDGDVRTRTSGGARPQCFVWMADDMSEYLDLGLAYDEVLDDAFPQPDLTVTEMLPATYGQDGEDDEWAMPALAQARERLEI